MDPTLSSAGEAAVQLSPTHPTPGELSAALGACGRLAALCDRVCANTDFAARGAQLQQHQRLQLGPFPEVALSVPWSWQDNPVGDRSWQWRLNWLSFLSYLLADHHRRAELASVQLACRAVLDWADHFGDEYRRNDFEFAWHDHGTALRAEQIALLIHNIERRALWQTVGGDAVRDRLVRLLLGHARQLARDGFYSRHTNHGLEQARVLLLLALPLQGAGLQEAEDWGAVAVERLLGELKHAFTDEGVHVENSPAYHVFVLKVFLGVLASFQDAGLEALTSWKRDTGPAALEFIYRVLRPDGKLPIIGDTEALPVTDSFADAFGGHPAYAELQYVLSRGAKGTRPRGLHRVYPRSGYAIFRSDWNAGPAFAQSFHLVFKAGALSRYHRQQDDGSLVVFHAGEDWLIDSGLYNYEQKSPVRQYMRSRQAHNVWVLDRAVPEGRQDEPAAIWRTVSYREDGPQPYIQADSSAYPQVRMSRRVMVFRRDCFRIDDVLCTLDGQGFSGDSLWHVPADKSIEVLNSSEVLIRSRATARVLRLRVLGDCPDAVRVRRGRTGSRVLSAVSTMANHLEDAQLLTLSFKARQSIVTGIEFIFDQAPG